MLLCSHLLWSQNSINVSSVEVSVNDNFSVGIGFTNSDAISAFQFDLHYDNNVMELASDHTLVGRGQNHTISTSVFQENVVRVVVFSSTNQLIEPGNGIVVNLNFTSKNDPGNYSVYSENVVLSDQNSSQISASQNNGFVTILGPEFRLITTNIDFGQVPMQSNESRQIQIRNEGTESLEILSQSLVSPLSISEDFPIVISAGNSRFINLNIDTSVSQLVDDQTLFETNDTDETRGLQELTVSADIYSVNEIHIGEGSGDILTSISIPVSINNMETFSGFQLDITIPNGVEYVENSISLSGRETDHTISGSVINSNILRVISFSSTNSSFTGQTGEVFSFSLLPTSSSGNLPLNISNPIISNTDLGNIQSNSFSGSISVNAPFLSLSPSNINLGRVPITIPKVNSISLTNSGATSLIIDEVTYNSSNLTSSIETPLSIQVSQTSAETITFNPNALGQFSSSLTINHNGTDNQSIIQITADVFSPNYLYIKEQSVYRDSNHIVQLGISNNDEIRALQFDINIPDGFIFDYENVEALNPLDGFTISSSDIGNGKYRFLIYNFGNIVIPVGSTLLLNLPVFINNSISLGDYTFDLSGVTLSNSSNSDVATEELEVGIIHVIENSAPVAISDTATVLEDSALTNIDVVSNDTDVEGDTLTLTAATTDGSGTVSVNADGLSVDYTPAANFDGIEVITYAVSDGVDSDDTGILTITVTAIPEAPVAVSDIATLLEDADLTSVNVVSNDTDIDGDSLTLIEVDTDGTGTVAVNTDGVSVDYTPASNFDGTEIVTYIVSDGLLIDQGTLTLTITPLNDPPVAVSDTATILEDSALTRINVILNDMDVEGDTLMLVAATTDGSGTVAVNTDGVSVDYTPAPNFNGTETITYTVSDGLDTNETGILTIIVTAVNDLPIAIADSATVDEDAPLTSIDVISNDTDLDIIDTLTLIAVTTDGAGTIAVNTDGVSVDYTPASNFNGTETITYTLFDGIDTITGTLTIIVTAVNDSPIAVSDSATVLEDSALTSIDLILNDMDVEGDTLILVAATTDGSGTVAVNTDGVSVDYTPAPNFNGTETITYTVSDGVDTDETGILTIIVTAVNDISIAIADSAIVDEDAPLTSIDVISNDTDLDIIDTLTLIAVTTDGTGTVSVNADGLSVDYIPASNFNGIETITYTLFDGTDTTTGTLTIIVTPVNDLPVAVSDTATLLEDSVLTSIDVISNDTDVDIIDTLTLISATTNGSGAIAINADRLSINYTPVPDFNGTETITYLVSDGTDTTIGILSIIVIPVNDPPIAVDDTYNVIENNTLISIDIIANDTDVDGDYLTLMTVITDGAGTVAVNTDGVSVDYLPAENFNGTDTINYTVSDGELIDEGKLTIIVVPVDDFQLVIPALDFPSFFTPNGDGINDTWNIKWVDTNNYFSSEVYIYNRFGKVVAKLNLNEQGWDGTYNGKTLPSGDYWVTIKLIPVNTDKKIIFKTGNFSLLRR